MTLGRTLARFSSKANEESLWGLFHGDREMDVHLRNNWGAIAIMQAGDAEFRDSARGDARDQLLGNRVQGS